MIVVFVVIVMVSVLPPLFKVTRDILDHVCSFMMSDCLEMLECRV